VTADPFSELRAAVDRGLATFLRRSLSRLVSLHPALQPAADELEAFVLGGGKRLRPVCLLLGHRAAGGTHERVMGPALALELLHTCALIHDDLIDDADTRRGRVSVQRRFTADHRGRGWRGEASAFGTAAAVLLGDLAFVLADELFLDADVPPDTLVDALRLFTTMREEVMAGQYLDVVAAHEGDRGGGGGGELALRIAALKSGRYTIARPLQLGAVLAGGGDDLIEDLFRFGEPLGQAFQIRDDVLGVFGAVEATGKPRDSDLREGKRTLLVAETSARLAHDDARNFHALLGRADLTAAEADELRSLMRESGGVEATAAIVDRLRDEALAALHQLDVDEDTRGTLEQLARFVVDRHG
jgi:geranylgeranyl diphosphate synthase type I